MIDGYIHFIFYLKFVVGVALLMHLAYRIYDAYIRDEKPKVKHKEASGK